MFKFKLDSKANRLQETATTPATGVDFSNQNAGIGASRFSQIMVEASQLSGTKAKQEFIQHHAASHAASRKQLHENLASHNKAERQLITLEDLSPQNQHLVETAYQQLAKKLDQPEKQQLLRDIKTMKHHNIQRFKDIAKHFNIPLDLQL
jgi:hypothetical protein